jgi:hypothetical protein
MDNDDFPDIPLDNFGADTTVAAPPAEDVKTAPDVQANGSEASQEAQPETAEVNPIAENGTSEQAVQNGPEINAQQSADSNVESQNTGRPEKQDRLQSRINDFTSKLYQKDAIITELQSKLATQEAMKGVTPLTPDEDGNIDPQALQQHIQQTAAAQAQAQVNMLNQRLEREQIAQNIDKEGSEIESKYKEYLDSDPIHAENIKALVEDKFIDNQYNLDGLRKISPMKIAERYFKGIEAASKKAQVQTQQNLQELQANTAVNPDASSGKDDSNSMEALEARLADIQF